MLVVAMRECAYPIDLHIAQHKATATEPAASEEGSCGISRQHRSITWKKSHTSIKHMHGFAMNQLPFNHSQSRVLIS